MFFDSLRRTLASSLVQRVEAEINQIWNLGRNVLIGWALVDSTLLFVSCPNYHLPLALGPHKDLPTADGKIPLPVLAALLRNKHFGCHRFRLTEDEEAQVGSDVIHRVLRRYGLARAENRAAVLFDIAGYSKLDPLHQVAQLNSLAYSVNVAHKRLLERGLDIELARSTTGDGFYMWSRREGLEQNVRLCALTMLALADNALALAHTPDPVVPRLRTAFHIGSHFEFYEAVGFTPETREYIVGDSTIKLARYLENADAGQVLFGDFVTPAEDNGPLDTEAFVLRAQLMMGRLARMQMSSAEVEEIQVYLTGTRTGEDGFVANRYTIADKHGNVFPVYNARCVIARRGHEKLFMGLRHPETPRFRLIEAAAA
jgi:class 3 adenylate cyclase